MDKLSWNPPKWKSYTLNKDKFKVELETGEILTGKLTDNFIAMDSNHQESCYKIFGQTYSLGSYALSELSRILDLDLKFGHWPEFHNVEKFLERYYERVAKIGNSNISKNISKICIDTEFNITPKFTI